MKARKKRPHNLLVAEVSTDYDQLFEFISTEKMDYVLELQLNFLRRLCHPSSEKKTRSRKLRVILAPLSLIARSPAIHMQGFVFYSLLGDGTIEGSIHAQPSSD